ncbi:MAG: hypothetical protein CVU54_15920 [Deltaproteobacteria bacterium HGW-Deltaproteobacteria-12]|jgi:hypothetical protein|nr:MAG: hypothetical protein CVU54_15920 [Deltaproteobacteria bacterium HGW-Deltaproteobacteria-12]
MEEYQEITEKISKLPVVQPPENLTLQVMQRITGRQRNPFYYLRDFLTKPRLIGLNPVGDAKNLAAEQSFLYFIMAGLAHMTLALVLFLGMRDIYGNVTGSAWMRIQPGIAFFLAIWLIVIGLLLWRRPAAGLKAARIAVFIYLEIILINAALPLLKFGKQLFLLPFWGLTATCLVVGGYLALLLQRKFSPANMKKRTTKWSAS